MRRLLSAVLLALTLALPAHAQFGYPFGPQSSAPSGNKPILNAQDFGAKCDGVAGSGTDDTAAIQAAITASANGSRLIIPNTGKQCIVGQLLLPSNTDLEVNAYLFLKPGNFQAVLEMQANVSNIYVHGTGTLDGNRTNQTGTSSGFQGLPGTNTNVTLTGLTIVHIKNFPVSINQTNGAWVSYVTISDAGNAPGFAVNCNSCWADHLRITNVFGDYGWAFYGGVTNSGITNSDISGSGAGGIVVLNDSGQAAICADILIENNLVHGNVSSGIEVSSGPVGGNGDNQRITIVGNRAYGDNTGNGTGHAEILLPAVSVSNVMGNTIGPGGNGSNGISGIALSAFSNTLLISGNTIFNMGVGGTNGVGISLGSSPQVVIANNNCFDNQGTMTMAFCLNGNWGANSSAMNNNLGPTIGVADNSVPLSTTVIAESPRFAKPFTVYPTVVVVPVPFASLPTCSATYKGGAAMITDASTTTPAWFAIAVGGGTTVVGVRCNGVNWLYG